LGWQIDNQLTGERLELGDKEAILFTNGENYGKDTIRIDEETWMVKKELDTAPFGKKSDSNTENVYYMIVSDEKEFMEDYLEKYQLEAEEKPVKWRESFNLKGSEEQKLKAVKELKTQAESEFEHTDVQGRYLEKETFFGLYGGVFFIGMYLGSLFLMATVLIIYYKQISEGFDDRERYQIMQKVGMSKREVKSSIRSQILMVFFLPLVMAIIHNCSCISGDHKAFSHILSEKYKAVLRMHCRYSGNLCSFLCDRICDNSKRVL